MKIEKKNHLGGQEPQNGMQNVTEHLIVLQMYDTTLVKGVEGKVANLSNFGNEWSLPN